jgi:hypothetical protein
MPLSLVKSGERVRITSIDPGNRFQCRLAEMGMIPFAENVECREGFCRHSAMELQILGDTYTVSNIEALHITPLF